MGGASNGENVMAWYSDLVLWLLKRVLPKRDPVGDEPGAGLTDAFNRFYSKNGELTTIRKREDQIMAAIKESGARTTTLRFLMNHKVGPYGQAFHPYRVFNNANSGFNQTYFNSTKTFCTRARKRKCNTQVEVWDMNYAHLGASVRLHGSDAFRGEVKKDQKDLMRKLVATLKGEPVSYVNTNEIDFSLRVPNAAWNRNAVRYMKTITDRPVGTWAGLHCPEADFRVHHGRSWDDFTPGSVCNEDGHTVKGVSKTAWGGGGKAPGGVWVPVTLQGYKLFLTRMEQGDVVPIINIWDDMLEPAAAGKCLPVAVAALKWAHEQGWWV